MKKILFVVTIFLVIGMSTGTGMTYHGKERGRNKSYASKPVQIPLHRWWKLGSVAEQFKITPEETKNLDALYLSVKEELIDSDALLKKQMLKLEMQFSSENFDKNKCMQTFKNAQEIRTKLAVGKFKFALKTREILGKERFEKLLNNFKKFRHRSVKRKKEILSN